MPGLESGLCLLAADRGRRGEREGRGGEGRGRGEVLSSVQSLSRV